MGLVVVVDVDLAGGGDVYLRSTDGGIGVVFRFARLLPRLFAEAVLGRAAVVPC